jgi:hypothetical protein
MNKKNILLIFLAVLGTYFLVSLSISSAKFQTLKSLFSEENKQLIKEYIFPHIFISQQKIVISKQKEKISKLPQLFSELEVMFKVSLRDIQIKKEKDIKLSNNKILKKYNLINGFYLGIHESQPGSGYIDFYQNNLIVLSSRGVLGFSKDIDSELNFKQIKNNINKFIGLKQFQKHKWFSLKDLFIHNNKIYISYTEEIKKDCWNTSIIYGNMNYKNIKFEKLFSNKECIHSSINIDNEFNAHQSGGRMIKFDENHILFSVGDYRNRFLAQEKYGINGKIIKININNFDYEIVSMGHRNPQGLYFDKENNFILETEHGPQGGDEINLIEVDKINKDEPLNYGWPVVSAGEISIHQYEMPEPSLLKKKLEKYPLYKSHIKYGFIEPLKSFVPSIGISNITKITDNKYVVSSLRDKSLYFFELNNDNKLINLERFEILERIRDLIFKDNKLYLFLESTASIGVITFN